MCIWKHPILNLLWAGRFSTCEDGLDKNILISDSEETGSGQPSVQIEKENKHYWKKSETNPSLKIAQHRFTSSGRMYTTDNIKNTERAKTTATSSVSKRIKTSLFDPADTYPEPQHFFCGTINGPCDPAAPPPVRPSHSGNATLTVTVDYGNKEKLGVWVSQ